MSTVADILRQKGPDVVTVTPDTTVLDTAKRMNEKRIGSVVVVGGSAREGGLTAVGMFTERDILTRVVSEERDPRSTRVGQVMTTPVICCGPATTLDELRGVMRSKRIRHVPVVEDSVLRGMVSIGDLNTAEAETLTQTIQVLEEFIHRA